MAYVYVDVELDTLDDDELIEEIEERGHKVIRDGNLGDPNELIQRLYMRVIMNKPYDDIVREIIWEKIGKIV